MPSGRPRLHRPASLAGLVAAGALLLSACAGDGGGTADTGTEFVTTGGGVSTVARGHRADAPTLDGTTLDGKPLDVAEYRGQVVVLNVWASTCGPCRLEAEHFAKVSEEYRGRGVQFVGINTRDVQKASAVSFERDYGVTYPSLHDPAGRLLLRFPKGTLNPQTIPSTVVIDREGKVAARALAALDEAGLREMIAPLATEK